MPHKGTPIRYEQKQPVRNRQQGVEKICELPHSGCSQIWVLRVVHYLIALIVPLGSTL